MESFFSNSIEPIPRESIPFSYEAKHRSKLSVDLSHLRIPSDHAFQKKRPTKLTQLDTIVSSSRNQISSSVKSFKHTTQSTPKLFAKDLLNPLHPLQQSVDSTKHHSISTTLKSIDASLARDSVPHFLIPFESGFKGKRLPFRSIDDLYSKGSGAKDILSHALSPSSNQTSQAISQPLSFSGSKKLIYLHNPSKAKKVNRKRAERIIQNFKQSCNVIRGPTLVEKSKYDFENEDKQVEELGNQLRDSLRMMITIMESSIEFRKDKELLDKFLKNMVSIAQKTKNLDLYMDCMLLQGKVLLIYHEVHKALNILKTLKNIAKSNKKFHQKLKAYKYLGKCFQQIGNFTMAEFYFVKFLQVSWILNKEKYEVQAYDLIGIQHYYMGDLEKANFFHNKTIGGVIEPKESEIRKLGISKMINKENEMAVFRKQFQLRTMEEELWRTDPPESEDEFELPAYSLENNEKSKTALKLEEGSAEDQMWAKKQRVRERHEKVHALKRMIDVSQKYNSKERVKERFVVEKIEPSQVSIIKARNEAILNPPRPQVLLCHLSPNRFLNNFHNLDSNMLSNPLMMKDNGGESLILLDSKSLDEIKKELFKTKVNLLEAELEISKILGKTSLLEEMKNINANKFKARRALRQNSEL